MNIRMMASGKVYTVTEVGYFSPFPKACDILTCGSVGYVAASIKNVQDCEVGDTITTAEMGLPKPCRDTGRLSPWFSADSIPLTVRTMII